MTERLRLLLTERHHLKVLHQSMQMLRDELADKRMQLPERHDICNLSDQIEYDNLTLQLLDVQKDLDQLATQLEKTGTTKIFSKSS